MSEHLEKLDLCLRILKQASEVSLSEEELAKVRRVALLYLRAELGLPLEEKEQERDE